MNMRNFTRVLETSPIIMALQNDDDLKISINSENRVVFVHYGTIVSIRKIIETAKKSNKVVFVNADMIDGITPSRSSVEFYQTLKIDGLISTKPSLLKQAQDAGMLTILRVFVIDSRSWRSINKMMDLCHANVINIVPGWPEVVGWTTAAFKEPVIASGLVCNKQLVIDNLNAGAIAVCTTNRDVWKM